MYLIQYSDENIIKYSINRYNWVARYAVFCPNDKTAKTLIKKNPRQRRLRRPTVDEHLHYY